MIDVIYVIHHLYSSCIFLNSGWIKSKIIIGGWMDGLIDGYFDGLMDGWIDGWIFDVND